MKNEMNGTSKAILTLPRYWDRVPESVKAMWQAKADQMSSAHRPATVCTHRPSLREFAGPDCVRRCSTGGRWGKSADVVRMSIDALLASGYILVTYVPSRVALAAMRDEKYSDDTH